MSNQAFQEITIDTVADLKRYKNEVSQNNNPDNEKNTLLNSIFEKLPDETTILIDKIAKQYNHSPNTNSDNYNYSEVNINKLMNALPSEALSTLKNIVDLYKVEIKNKAVRSQPKMLQRAVKQKKALELFNSAKTEEERLTIYESGVALGLVVGSSTKDDVIEIMKQHSEIIYQKNSTEPIFFYDDIHVSVFFDANDIIREVQFGAGFKGETCLGLKVGDTISRAIELYGEPRMKSSKAVLWSYFSIFCLNNRIRCIRIQS